MIEQIKSEIRQLKNKLIRGACASQIEMETNCKDEAYDEVLAIIERIEKEQLAGLDEAAEKFNREDAARMWDYEGKTEGEIVQAAFKAGAEWMAGQGETTKGEIVQNYTGSHQLFAKAKVSNKNFKFGDKVIVQIRKVNEKEK